MHFVCELSENEFERFSGLNISRDSGTGCNISACCTIGTGLQWNIMIVWCTVASRWYALDRDSGGECQIVLGSLIFIWRQNCLKTRLTSKRTKHTKYMWGLIRKSLCHVTERNPSSRFLYNCDDRAIIARSNSDNFQSFDLSDDLEELSSEIVGWPSVSLLHQLNPNSYLRTLNQTYIQWTSASS